VKNRSRPALLAGIILLGALAGCAPGGGGDTGTGGSTGGGSDAGPNCDGVTTAGYELFVDPRLAIDPQLDLYPLGGSESYAFTDSGTDGEYTTYSYSLSYIDEGTVFPNTGAIFVGAEDTNAWTLDGPISASGIDGGPYAGFLDIEATTGAGTEVLARLCVVLAP
jgi:hypothetical protein